MIKKQASIFLNGKYTDNESGLSQIRPDCVLIGVDGGTLQMVSYSLTPQVIIGDMDSLPTKYLTKFESGGIEIDQHSARKNESDFELALDYAIAQECEDILVFGGLGGRTDQMLANILLPATYLEKAQIRLFHGQELISYITRNSVIHGKSGDVISFLPIQKDVTGILTTGLEYPLLSETLNVGKTRGISNVMIGDIATVSISSGILVCIHIPCAIKDGKD